MLMGSFNSSNPNQEEEEEEEEDPDLQIYQHSSSHSPNAIHMRQLLITSAHLISRLDFSAAHRLISMLSANSSPYGDSTERLLHQFTTALSLRLSNPQPSSFSSYAPPTTALTSTTAAAPTATATASSSSLSYSEDALHSCYLTLNQITPFIRFIHLTANQAILEAMDEGQQALHILDFDIMHGVQWPPFMQALAERSYNSLNPPPLLRITATGHDLPLLRRTGDRLSRFAHSLGLRFQFHPLLIPNNNYNQLLIPSALAVLPDEALAVNCVLYLHRLLKDDDCGELRVFLEKIKALNPKVVTVAEREVNTNHPVLAERLAEALDHYAAIFESLEATLPPNSRERLAVEQIWLGREIMEVVGAADEDDDKRRLRSQRLDWWEVKLRSSGFSNVALSPFALSQAKMLLRLHYPSEGYHLHILNDSFFLGWQNRPLFSISSWH
ncbi:hypothetical protein UlMin_019428 [Ulmus minor]